MVPWCQHGGSTKKGTVAECDWEGILHQEMIFGLTDK